MYYYIHIPFCKSKCKYCSFASFAWQEDRIEEYLNFLKKEIRNHFSVFNAELLSIESIYFWGWTPSILSPKQISEILNIFKEFWNISQYTEITLESNPENLNQEYLKEIYSIWINRISVWIQSLNDKVLSVIWRRPSNLIFEALDNLSKSDFENIWLDFIIGLPNEKQFWVANNIEILLQKYPKIKHVSTYFLEWIYPEKWNELNIWEDHYLEEYEKIIEVLSRFWINKYEISNFTKKWFGCKHNLAYWNHREYYWFWLNASSFVWNKRFWNAKTFQDYYAWKLEYEEDLSIEDLILEKLMFQIRTSWIEKGNIRNENKLTEFLSDWLLVQNDSKIQLTKKGILLTDYILKGII